jgi:hypothetical protein
VASFKILSRLLPVRSVETHASFIQGTRSPDSTLNEGPPVHDAGELTTCVCVRVSSTNRTMTNVFVPTASCSKKTLQLCTFLTTSV